MAERAVSVIPYLRGYYREFLRDYHTEVEKKMVEAVVTDFIVYSMEKEGTREEDVKHLLKEKGEKKEKNSEIILILRENIIDYSMQSMMRINARRKYGYVGKANLAQDQVEKIVSDFMQGYENS